MSVAFRLAPPRSGGRWRAEARRVRVVACPRCAGKVSGGGCRRARKENARRVVPAGHGSDDVFLIAHRSGFVKLASRFSAIAGGRKRDASASSRARTEQDRTRLGRPDELPAHL